MPLIPSEGLPEIVKDLNDPESEVRKQIQKIEEPVTNEAIKNTIRDFFPDEEYIGMGSEAIVIADKSIPETVVAYHTENPTIYRAFDHIEKYHIHRIMHNLFPHNFPNIKSIWNKETPVTYRDRIREDADANTIYPIEKVMGFFDEIGLDLFIDTGSEDNFIKSADGDEYYVDLLNNRIPAAIFTHDFATEETFTLGLMKDGKLKPQVEALLGNEEKKQVLASLNRLKEISIIESIQAVLENPEKHKEKLDIDNMKLVFNKVNIDTNNLQSMNNITRFVEIIPTKDEELKKNILLKLGNLKNQSNEAEKTKKEQVQEFIDNNLIQIKDFYIKLCEKKYSNEEYRKEILEEDLPSAVEREKQFIENVLGAFDQWSREENVVVLWDVDETLGKWAFYENGEEEWYLRPSLIPLLKYLAEKYPNIQNGILSNRSELESQINNPQLLEPIKPYFKIEHLYSSRGIEYSDEKAEELKKRYQEKIILGPNMDAIQKSIVIDRLRQQGHNIKVIDDNMVAQYEGENGIYVRKFIPSI